MEALFGGVVLGLSVAAPPGPNAALCMAQALAGGRRAGLRAGLGAASAHALYAGLALTGAGRVSGLLSRDAGAVRVVAGVVLVGLGLRRALTPTPRRLPSSRGFALTLGLALANPLTLVYFTAAVTLRALPMGAGPVVVLGVFAGSASWWALLASAVAGLGRRLDDRRLAWANRLVAAAVAGCGAVAIATVLG